MKQSVVFQSSSVTLRTRPGQRSSSDDRRAAGFTLVEMLVSMAITLIMLFAIVQIFSMMGEGVNSGRSIIEMSGQLRQAANMLQQDLDGATAPSLPWARAGSGFGYTEIIEGPEVDFWGATYPKIVSVADWTPVENATVIERPWDTDDVDLPYLEAHFRLAG